MLTTNVVQHVDADESSERVFRHARQLPKKLQSLVRRFRGRRVAVVGDYMLDRFIRGSTSRISPEAPVPVVQVNRPESAHLGGAGNVVANLAALGARPAAFGVAGKDEAGAAVRRELAKRSGA